MSFETTTFNSGTEFEEPYSSINCCPYSTDSGQFGTVFEGWFLLIFLERLPRRVAQKSRQQEAQKLRQSAGQISGLR